MSESGTDNGGTATMGVGDAQPNPPREGRGKPYRILLADDEETLLHSTCRLLEKQGWECVCASTATAVLERLHAEDFDVLVADYKMPGNENLQLLDLKNDDFPDIPTIIITGYPSMNSAIQSLQLRAFDYLTKPVDNDYLFKRIREAAAQRRLKAALDESEGRYRELVEDTENLVTQVDREGRFLYVNPMAESVFGLSPEACVGLNAFDFVHPEDRDRTRTAFEDWLRDGPDRITIENRQVSRSGEVRDMLWKISLHFDSQGKVAHIDGIGQDITKLRRIERERRQLAAEVWHNQKIESLGVMAGGIAHDFNNLLFAVQGNLDLVLDDVPEESEVRLCIEEANRAAQRASDLARKMLAYSGQGNWVKETIDLSGLVRSSAQFFEASASRNVSIEYRLETDLPPIEGDPSQLEQVVMNLLLNASEAIGKESGTITVRVGLTDASAADLAKTYVDDRLPAGCYIHLEVSDTGSGIEAKIVSKIYDPFFTTRFHGRGLGLSTVLGIVRGHKGAIEVSSETGRGTTFKVLFPALGETPVQPVPEVPEAAKEWRGSGTILLVDDEAMLRRMGTRLLEGMGFAVLTAGDGVEALEVYRANADSIDCVLLDLTMPRMDGEEAFRELRRLNKDLPIVLSSAYAEKEVTQRFEGEGPNGFLRKPYPSAALRRMLREVLDG